MLRVEFHCHTSLSPDCLLSPRDLLTCGARKGIDRVIVTDHNTIRGALAAHALEPERIIVGEEIMTTHGELLAAFVSSEIPAGLSPQETIARLRSQGAFISVAHPFDRHRKGGWRQEHLLDILPMVDAIETFNSRCMLSRENALAADFARVHEAPATVGSDAHTCWELGRATLLLPPFSSADQLREVIHEGQAVTRPSPPWIHLSSRYAVFRKRISRNLDTASPA